MPSIDPYNEIDDVFLENLTYTIITTGFKYITSFTVLALIGGGLVPSLAITFGGYATLAFCATTAGVCSWFYHMPWILIKSIEKNNKDFFKEIGDFDYPYAILANMAAIATTALLIAPEILFPLFTSIFIGACVVIGCDVMFKLYNRANDPLANVKDTLKSFFPRRSNHSFFQSEVLSSIKNTSEMLFCV